MLAKLAVAASLLITVIDPARAEPTWGELRPLYEDLHAHPELGFQETATAAKLAERLRALGFEVTTGIAKTGVVGILKNGPGPTLMVRTEMDALPVQEKTGLPFASKATVKNAAGETVSVMHACGHDLHMTAWVGTATKLAADRKSWHGTLMMVAQPAEEGGGGAAAMLGDGLYTRFPRPDFAIAVHDNTALPAGTIGIKPGPLFASADMVDLDVYGRGGHGGVPHATVDPIVIAAKIVLGIQTLISRENNPFDPAVITVGSIHGGTKHNIIPDSVHLQLTVRAFKPEVRKALLDGIARVARAEAMAANAPLVPEMSIASSSPATVNDPALAERVTPALRKALGDARVREAIPVTAGEDFSRFAEAGTPILVMWVGAVEPAAFEKAERDGTTVPSIHSALFAPDAERATMTAIDAVSAAATELLKAPGKAPKKAKPKK
jgi:amidohydrolase